MTVPFSVCCLPLSPETRIYKRRRHLGVKFQLGTQMSNAADIRAGDTSVTSTFLEVRQSSTDFIVQALRELDSQTRSFVQQQQDAIKATHAKWNDYDSSATKHDVDYTVQR